MKFLFSLMLTFFSLVGFCIGILFITKPAVAIEIQRRFYAKINWKIEPISMQKELRNTRMMGLILVILLLFALFIYVKNIKLYCLAN